MIDVIISAVIAWGVITLLERGKGRGLDGIVIAGIVVVPAIIFFLLSLAFYALGLPSVLVFALYIIYFAVPAVMLRVQLDFPLATACLYGGIVLLVVVTTQVLLGLLLTQLYAY